MGLTNLNGILDNAAIQPQWRDVSYTGTTTNQNVESLPYYEQFPHMATSQRQGPAQWVDNRDNYVRQYTGSAYIAIGAIARMAAMQKAKVLRRIRKKSGTRYEEVRPTHPLIELFEEVNPVDTPWDLWFYTIGWELIAGNAYIYKARNGFGTPKQLWPMPPQWVQAIPDPVTYIAGYEINSKFGFKFRVPRENIIDIKAPSLDWSDTGRYYGQPAIKAAAVTLDLENEMLKRLYHQFKNFAPPSMVFETDQRLQPHQVQQLWAQFAAQHSMSEATGRPMIVHSGMKLSGSWNSNSDKELSYTDSLDKTMEMTMATLGVPRAIVGMNKDSNRCLDDQTECLTDSGWISYDKITYDTKIACYDPDGQVLRYRKPSGIFIYDYDGPMHLWKTKNVNCLVTPNHRMYRRRKGEWSGYGDGFQFYESRDIVNKPTHEILAAPPNGAACSLPVGPAIEVGPDESGIKVIEIPDSCTGWLRIADAAAATGKKECSIRYWADKGWIRSRKVKVNKGNAYMYREVLSDDLRSLKIPPQGGMRDVVHIDANDYLELVGWYVSEGCVSFQRGAKNSVKGRVIIDQSQSANPDKVAKIDRLMDRLPFNVCRHEHYSKNGGNMVRWLICDLALAKRMRDHCGSGAANKKIPSYVKDYPSAALKVLLDAAVDGDGHRCESGRMSYTSTSSRLADDIQEIAIKCGYSSSKRFVKSNNPNHRDQYYVSIVPHRKTHGLLTAKSFSEIAYSGKVWCVEVPTGLFVVRRNGTVHITGNSNTEAAISSFAHVTLNPLLEQVSQHLTQNLARDFAPDRSLIIQIGPCEVNKIEGLRRSIETMIRAGAITPNEVRHMLAELPPIEGEHGDHPVMISGFQQTGPEGPESEGQSPRDQVAQVSRMARSGQNQHDTAEPQS